ncbi:MAG: DUF202 domain-containing protein [Thermoleophilaceae bacterium]|jgi:uncharacterized membrane protein YidH (DUF202 family)|nr:DUF202 domain-containing protein [Thermoleophilaceae bacterium]
MSADASSARVPEGRALERTALAWNRSALSLAATGGLVTKAGADQGSLTSGLVGGGVLLFLAVAVWIYGRAAYRDRRTRSSTLFSPRVAHSGLTAVSVAAGVVALVIVL